jgi:hypothetical protein
MDDRELVEQFDRQCGDVAVQNTGGSEPIRKHSKRASELDSKKLSDIEFSEEH